MNKVGWGIIGLGRISHVFCKDLQKSQVGELVAVASRSDEKAKDFAEQYGAKRSYGNYQDIVLDDEVDVIYIATPHTFHKEISIMCMNAGKAVLCEKAVTVNLKELDELIGCAKKNNVFFMEAMWARFFPLNQQIREIVKSKELGEARIIQANFGFGEWNDGKLSNPDARLYSMDLAGGAILDLGVYCAAYSTWIKNKLPETIKTVASKIESGADGMTASILQYDDASMAILQFSICQETEKNAIIHFDKGKIEAQPFWSPTKITITKFNGEVEVFEDDYEQRGIAGYLYEIEHVHKCLNDNLTESPYMTLENSREVMFILDKMREQVDLVYPFE